MKVNEHAENEWWRPEIAEEGRLRGKRGDRGSDEEAWAEGKDEGKSKDRKKVGEWRAGRGEGRTKST